MRDVDSCDTRRTMIMTPQIANPAAWDIASLGTRIGRLDPSSGTSAEPF
jgi:hypothetical protein